MTGGPPFGTAGEVSLQTIDGPLEDHFARRRLGRGAETAEEGDLEAESVGREEDPPGEALEPHVAEDGAFDLRRATRGARPEARGEGHEAEREGDQGGAAEHGVDETAALDAGMAEKSAQFRAAGAEVYRPG